jgi:Family of unknown function (DUF5678)
MTEQGEIHTVVLEQQSRDTQSDADAKFACERQAFWAMHAQLLSMYEGKYVAVLDGQVVDSDVDERALVQRVYQKFGYQPMYVQLVTSGSLPVYRLMSPQVMRQ